MTIACPGPVATGSANAPRNVFSSTGLVAKHEPRGGGSKRLAPALVAQLIARAAYKCGPLTQGFELHAGLNFLLGDFLTLCD